MERQCGNCQGAGYVYLDGYKKYLCISCGGRGFIIFCPDCDRPGIMWTNKRRTCLRCGKEI
jgi:ribosomal protein S27E